MKTFEELHCWQKAKDLTVSLYSYCNSIEDTLMREMMINPCVCIGKYIAIGHGKSIKDNIACLVQARESSAQLRQMLHIAKELDYIDEKTFTNFYNDALDLAKMLSGLIKAIKQKPVTTKA